jgi:hypothetical protein
MNWRLHLTPAQCTYAQSPKGAHEISDYRSNIEFSISPLTTTMQALSLGLMGSVKRSSRHAGSSVVDEMVEESTPLSRVATVDDLVPAY